MARFQCLSDQSNGSLTLTAIHCNNPGGPVCGGANQIFFDHTGAGLYVQEFVIQSCYVTEPLEYRKSCSDAGGIGAASSSEEYALCRRCHIAARHNVDLMPGIGCWDVSRRQTELAAYDIDALGDRASLVEGNFAIRPLTPEAAIAR